jgi:fatty acid desaturase
MPSFGTRESVLLGSRFVGDATQTCVFLTGAELTLSPHWTLLTDGFQWSELWRYPILYVLPLVTLFLFFIRLRMFLEHGSLNYEICDYFEGKRPTTRTIYASPVERIFLCGNSFNFHNEHHRYPTVPGWQLPRLHRELAGGIDPEDVRQTYAQAFVELWRNLPWRGRQEQP